MISTLVQIAMFGGCVYLLYRNPRSYGKDTFFRGISFLAGMLFLRLMQKLL